MSQNATSRRGLDKGLSKTNNNDTQKMNSKNTNISKSTALKQTTQNSEDNQIQHQTTYKPTAEQVRLASLIGNKNEDPEINKQIKQVLDIVPSKKSDEILMLLHEFDYDVPKTIEYLLDGGDLTQDWKTAGKQKKTTTSPNQTLEDVEKPQQQQHQQSKQTRHHKNDSTNGHHTNGDRHKENNFNGHRQRGDKNNRKFDKNNRNADNDHMNSEGGEGHELDTNNHGDDNQERQFNNKRNQNSMRGGNRGNRGGGSNRGGRGGRGGYRNNQNRNDRGQQREAESRNEELDNAIQRNLNIDNIHQIIDINADTNIAQVMENINLNDQLTDEMKRLYLSQLKTHQDSLRDIGTWSNEQATSESNNRRSYKSNNRQQQQNNNRHLNKKNLNGQNNEYLKQNEDLDNDEEWQGDLTKTQIFTASNQNKQATEEAGNDSTKRDEFNSDFPIGHFNTEEAAQKIKNAIGIVTSIAPKSTEEPPKPETVNKEEKQQTMRTIKIGSVKPPPPSTKIPKSAVVMPGGNTNGLNLDVQFGVDFIDTSSIAQIDSKVQEKAKSTQKPNVPVNSSNSTSPQQQQQQRPSQAPQPQRLQKESTHQAPVSSSQQLNSYEPVKTLNNNESQKIGVVNPVVVNKAPVIGNKDSSILSNLPLESTNVSSLPNVLSGLPKVDLMSNSTSTSLNQQNFIGQQQNQQAPQKPTITSQQTETKKQDNVFITDAQKEQKQYIQIQQQLQQQSNLNKFEQPKSNTSQQTTNQTKQYMNQLGQDVSLNGTSITNSHSTSQQHYQNQLNAINNNGNVSSNNSNQIKSSASSQNINLNTSQTNSSQLLNQISPQNSQKGQSNGLNSTSLNSSSVGSGASNKQTNSNSSSNSNNTMAPPPGVNMVNPNNQFMVGLPFQQQFPYFDPSQMDGNSIMQMYNHLASVAPPGVGSATGAGGATQGGPPYSIDSKFNRSQDSTGSNSQLNPNAQLSQQQQQPMNMIPGLNNFPFFFPNYYPNMFMSMPQNGPQQQQAPQQNPQQFQNKPPYNFNNNAGSVGSGVNGVNEYEVQTKDYTNYSQQSQMKSSGSNLNNVSEMSSYQKNLDKSNTGYHTPPPNYSNSLMNQQPHPNVTGNSGAPIPPTQYAYMTSMIGTPGGNPHGMQQENINSRGIGNNNSNSIKQLQKTANYQNSPWS